MKILTIHNRYRFRGGEDETREVEDELLRSYGHEVVGYDADNTGIDGRSVLSAAIGATWNHSSYRRIKELIRRERPAVINVDNFFPLISPAVFYAAADSGVPVVQTLHNFRLLCPAATLFRDGRICEECIGRTIPWPSLVNACYRGSRLATAPVMAMLGIHNLIETWSARSILFVALSEFARLKFIAGGIPERRLTVRSICLRRDIGPGSGDGDYILFVGRLVAEKGIDPLLTAWQDALPRGRLLIVGEGPLARLVARAAHDSPSIEYLGRLPHMEQVYDLMRRARALVVPSLWYEGMPRTIVEAFCCGTPVIASDLGSMREMIRHGETGWLVKPGNVRDLGAVMRDVVERFDLSAARLKARADFEAKYTAPAVYESILDIFQRAMQ